MGGKADAGAAPVVDASDTGVKVGQGLLNLGFGALDIAGQADAFSEEAIPPGLHVSLEVLRLLLVDALLAALGYTRVPVSNALGHGHWRGLSVVIPQVEK